MIVSVRESAETMDDILCVGQPVDQDGVNLGPKRQLNLVQTTRPRPLSRPLTAEQWWNKLLQVI